MDPKICRMQLAAQALRAVHTGSPRLLRRASPQPYLPPRRETLSRVHEMCRLVTCTASGAAARSTVEALTFRAVTRTLLFDQTWQ